MPVFQSRVKPDSDAFKANREGMLALVEELRTIEGRVQAHSIKRKDRFKKRGQLPPRERVARLLDRGAPFLEFSTLAGLGMHDDGGKTDPTGGGVITGIGFVSGVRCLVSASDSAIKGGTITPMGLAKGLRAQDIARLNKLPSVSMIESGGANLLYQSEIFVMGGRTFANQARHSAAGIPQLTIVNGSSTAGGAYRPGMSDINVVVRGRSKIFLAGPPLLKAATGEIATDEELGGAEMHALVAGTAEYLVEDDAEAARVGREIIGRLGWVPGESLLKRRPYKEPRHAPEELCGAVPVDYRKPYDCREIIARIVDDSDFLEFKALYGPQTVCVHAAIEGIPVGILGNNGPIYPEGSVKATQFIQLCCQSGIPLVYLQNTTGYMVGKQAEAGGAIKHGSKMIQAVANATVPQVTVIVGGSFGAGNYGMCGRSFDPRFIFAWPNARISVMGPEQLAKTMSIVTEEKFRRDGKEIERSVLDAMEQKIIAQVDRESTALYATARLWDDGIIDPRDTRKVLGFCLATALEAEARVLHPNTFGVARG
ncbi:MAG: acyl-CoA carboxylase subunit beta [Alphaproteobacteria bacterium]|nr:acyl-CoA carboxylase subunit beta [Alphaproteobacteria bacterium]